MLEEVELARHKKLQTKNSKISPELTLVLFCVLVTKNVGQKTGSEKSLDTLVNQPVGGSVSSKTSAESGFSPWSDNYCLKRGNVRHAN